MARKLSTKAFAMLMIRVDDSGDTIDIGLSTKG